LWQPLEVSAELVTRAWQLEDRFELSFWDSLIVSAALVAGCSHLLSEDLQSGADYGGVQVVNPFEVRPDEMLGSSG